MKFLAGKLRQFQVRAEPGADSSRIHFRHADVRANRIRSRKHKQFLRAAAVPGVYQVAKVHVTTRDHTAERRVHMLERFQFLEPADVGLR